MNKTEKKTYEATRLKTERGYAASTYNATLLCMAVMALAGMALAGCQKEETMIVGDGVHFSATVRMAGGGTKALDAAGHKTFAVGDQIAVVYTNTSGTTVKAVSAALTQLLLGGPGRPLVLLKTAVPSAW